jgi:hypothetical protein
MSFGDEKKKTALEGSFLTDPGTWMQQWLKPRMLGCRISQVDSGEELQILTL